MKTSNWHDDYQQKLCSAAAAAKLVQSGHAIYTGGFSMMPHDFTEALAARKGELQGVSYFGCLSPYCFKILDGEFKGHIDYVTIFTGPYERHKAPEGNINQLSVHLAESDRFVRERVQPDILAVNVSAPDKHGWMTFGPCGGMAIHAARELATTIIVTVQPSQPRVPGEFNMIHVSEVDAIIETDIPIPHLPSAPASELEKAIAAHVIPLVEDGSTIQVGIGGVPGAITLGLPAGTPVTTPRTDVEYIATEYGVVNLRYQSNIERARALISIAHPDFRDALRAGLAEHGVAL